MLLFVTSLVTSRFILHHHHFTFQSLHSVSNRVKKNKKYRSRNFRELPTENHQLRITNRETKIQMSVIGCHPMSRHPMNQTHLNEATRMSQSEMSQTSMSPTSMSSMSTADVAQPASNVERRTFVARSNLFLNFNNRRNIQVGNIPLISPISILSPTSPNGTIFSQIRISPNSLASPLGENGFTLSRRLLGPPDKETETFINTVLELEKEHNKPKQNKENHQRLVLILYPL